MMGRTHEALAVTGAAALTLAAAPALADPAATLLVASLAAVPYGLARGMRIVLAIFPWPRLVRVLVLSRLVTGILRIGALVWAATAAPPIMAAFCAARLPDRLECRRLRGRFPARMHAWFTRNVPHRGPTHWLITCLSLAVAVGVAAACVRETRGIAVWLAAGFAAGYLLHPLADGCTLSGVELWKGREVHLLPEKMRVRTDSQVDAGIRMAATLGTVALLYFAVA